MNDFTELLFDWLPKGHNKIKQIELNDETLRDGLQATYVNNFSYSEKIHFLHLIIKAGIQSANIGFPASSPQQYKDVLNLTQYVKKHKLNIKLNCGARSVDSDINPVLDIIQKTGFPLEVGIFIGSSKIRQLVEKWDLLEISRFVKKSVKHATTNGAQVMFVTEDSTRAHPKTLEYLYKTAIDAGASRICVCDTVGTTTPTRVLNLLGFIYKRVIKNSGVKVDWHGHNDRGLAVANSLTAAEYGVDRIQATALGVGERAGNAAMEQVLINLWLEGLIKVDVVPITEYTKYAAKVLGVKLRHFDPVVGSDIFSTATGVHAAAIKKAYALGQKNLAGLIYSAVNPYSLGREPDIKVGPMSGKANIIWKLEQMKYVSYSEEQVIRILNEVKRRGVVMTEKQLEKLIVTIIKN
jgi:2-isopropylmalate synthase